MTDQRQEVSVEQMEVIKAVLGQDAETFRRTKLGRYIYDRIAVEEEQLIEDLIVACASSIDTKVVNLALDIMMHRRLPLFIDEAIQSGHAAERNLDQMESSQRDY